MIQLEREIVRERGRQIKREWELEGNKLLIYGPERVSY